MQNRPFPFTRSARQHRRRADRPDRRRDTPSPTPWSATATSCSGTASGCPDRTPTPRTRCRRRSCAPGAHGDSLTSGCPRAWLYRIATNACFDVLARRDATVVSLDDEPRARERDRAAGAAAGRDRCSTRETRRARAADRDPAPAAAPAGRVRHARRAELVRRATPPRRCRPACRRPTARSSARAAACARASPRPAALGLRHTPCAAQRRCVAPVSDRARGAQQRGRNTLDQFPGWRVDAASVDSLASRRRESDEDEGLGRRARGAGGGVRARGAGGSRAPQKIEPLNQYVVTRWRPVEARGARLRPDRGRRRQRPGDRGHAEAGRGSCAPRATR